jgi:hypothetical protein
MVSAMLIGSEFLHEGVLIMSQRSDWASRLERSEIHRDDECFSVLCTAVSIEIREHWGSKWEFDADRSWDRLAMSVARRLGGTEADLLDPAARQKFDTYLYCAGQMLLGRGLVRYPDQAGSSTVVGRE